MECPFAEAGAWGLVARMSRSFDTLSSLDRWVLLRREADGVRFGMGVVIFNAAGYGASMTFLNGGLRSSWY